MDLSYCTKFSDDAEFGKTARKYSPDQRSTT